MGSAAADLLHCAAASLKLGAVETHADIYGLPAALPLECDDLLIAPQVAFETYGSPQAEGAILVIPGVAQSHHAATGTPQGPGLPYSPDAWFAGAIGPGAPLDTSRFFVICAGLLGSPWGSSSPLTLHPEYDAPYAIDFPPVTVTDMARAVAALCRGLGVTRLLGAVGLSLGGMVALRLAGLFPELVGSVAALGTTAALPDALRRKLATIRQILESDRAYRHGLYSPREPPIAALQRARLTLLRDLADRDHLLRLHGDLFAGERALEQEAQSFARQYDANCYATLCEAHARVDLHATLSRIKARTLLLTASSDPFAPPERARDTYHRLTANGVSARYHELQSDAGHHTYGLEAAKVGQVLREFFGR